MNYPFLPLNEYIPDGEAHVLRDRVYLFGSHDRAGGDSYCLEDYEFYSAPVTDLTDWSSRGISYRAKQDPGYSKARPSMYAPDCVRGNDGRYYIYYAMGGFHGSGGYSGPVRAAVSDRPDGPYEFYGTVQDEKGNPFLRCVPFDPAVMNDNGVIRLYYGAGYPFENISIPGLKGLLKRLEAKKYQKSLKEIEQESLGVNGALTVTLKEDMLTVASEPIKITPNVTKGTQWEKHPFFEAGSIRKIEDIYYFIYSSQKGHELCYATSRFPDREFKYRGVIISNGDIGYKGRKSRHRIAMTGNNHGCIECIQGQWYIFYHRQTNGTNFSRQACVEPIRILEDGSIPQVCVTSMGFHGEAWKSSGVYPAAIACVLNNGRIGAAGSGWNKKRSIPKITQMGNDVFITGITHNTRIGIRYFQFDDRRLTLSMRIRGTWNGIFRIYQGEGYEKLLGTILVRPSMNWKIYKTTITPVSGIHTLSFLYRGRGMGEFDKFKLES